MLSLITASRSPEKVANWKRAWTNILAGQGPFEFLVQENAKSICEAYDAGQRAAIEHSGKDRDHLLIFVHDDVQPLSQTFAPRLRAHFHAGIDVVGGAGATKCIGDKWFLAGPPFVHGQVLNYVGACKGTRPRPWRSTDTVPSTQTQVMEEVDVPQHFSLAAFGVYSRLARNICVADGFFLAARPGVLVWDKHTYDHFHLYDCDATYTAYKQGYQVAIANDLNLLHASQGGYNQPEFPVQAAKFLKKWEKHLPPQPPLVNGFNTCGIIAGDIHSAVEVMEQLVANTET